MITGTILVYIGENGGTMYEYDISAETIESFNERAREHCAQITMYGYRSSCNDGKLTFYPPHRIFKVRVKTENLEALKTNYPDRKIHT
jgi:hypothetical protein